MSALSRNPENLCFLFTFFLKKVNRTNNFNPLNSFPNRLVFAHRIFVEMASADAFNRCVPANAVLLSLRPELCWNPFNKRVGPVPTAGPGA